MNASIIASSRSPASKNVGVRAGFATPAKKKSPAR
jgi:hypothetical protein